PQGPTRGRPYEPGWAHPAAHPGQHQGSRDVAGTAASARRGSRADGIRRRLRDDDPEAGGGGLRCDGSGVHRRSGAARRPRGQTPAAVDLHAEGGCGSRGPHVLWAELHGHLPARGVLRRQDPARRQAGRPARGAADEVRARHQPQDGKDPRVDHPVVAPAARRRGDPVTTRRAFLGTLVSSLVAASLAAEAQPRAGKVWRIGFLEIGSRFAPDSISYQKAFMQGLQEHAYITGQNFVIEFRGAEGKQERPPALAAELVRLDVDVLVAFATLSTLAAYKATKTIPIVMVSVGDPVGTGFAATLAHPGGNLTGVSDVNADLSAKRLDLLKEALPRLARAAVLLNPAHPPNVRQLEETLAAARVLRITLQTLEVQRSDEFERAFAAAGRAGAGAVIVLPDAFTGAHGGRIAELAARHRLPTMFSERTQAVGGLMS